MPGIVTILVPAAIIWWTGDVHVGWGLPTAAAAAVVALGCGLLVIGLLLVARTVALFATGGAGTIAPWDPTTQLVAVGPYRRVRNPMISGVLFVLLGEAVLLGSVPVLLWFGAVLVANALYMPLVEEPGLERRFGEEYERYRANVPRWLPRLHQWDPTA